MKSYLQDTVNLKLRLPTLALMVEKEGNINNMYKDCVPQILREERHKKGCHEICGQVIICKNCDQTHSTTEVMTTVLGELK